MLLKRKLLLAFLGISLFIVLVTSIVLIDSGKTLNKAIELTSQWNTAQLKIIEAQEAEKNYVLERKGLIPHLGAGYEKEFFTSVDSAKDASRRDKEIVIVIEIYSDYFTEVLEKDTLDEKTIETLRDKGNEARKIVSEKVVSVQNKAGDTQKRISSILLVAFFVGAGVSVGGAVFFSRLIAEPLVKLTRSARKIAEGDISQEVPVISQDEIGEIAAVVNKLSHELFKANKTLADGKKDLELQLARHTKELQDKQSDTIESERKGAVEQLVNAIDTGLTMKLSNLRALVYQMRDKIPKEEKALSLDMTNVVRSVNQATRVSNNILAYFKHPVLNIEFSDVNRAIQETLMMKEKEGIFDDIKVVRRLQGGIPQIPLDARYMKIALDNLFTNAYQAMSGAGELIVMTSAVPGEIEIKITDSGVGVSDDNRGKIFTPFFTTREDNLGLGLVVVREIIKQHRGNIAMQSTVGKGTTFIIKLPVVPK
ncbi:MAG: ATP-binding protein [bacterium]